jgi:outer membrane protein assembly factor BamD (BamD/ComL family)
MNEPATNQLMQRVLRFLNYNAELYVYYRRRGDYHAAVQRLERVSKLVNVAEQAEREGKSQLDWVDQATLTLARQHTAMILQRKVLDSLAV